MKTIDILSILGTVIHLITMPMKFKSQLHQKQRKCCENFRTIIMKGPVGIIENMFYWFDVWLCMRLDGDVMMWLSECG